MKKKPPDLVEIVGLDKLELAAIVGVTLAVVVVGAVFRKAIPWEKAAAAAVDIMRMVHEARSDYQQWKEEQERGAK